MSDTFVDLVLANGKDVFELPGFSPARAGDLLEVPDYCHGSDFCRVSRTATVLKGSEEYEFIKAIAGGKFGTAKAVYKSTPIEYGAEEKPRQEEEESDEPRLWTKYGYKEGSDFSCPIAYAYGPKWVGTALYIGDLKFDTPEAAKKWWEEREHGEKN